MPEIDRSARDEAIRRLHSDGMSVRRIALAMGLGTGTVGEAINPDSRRRSNERRAARYRELAAARYGAGDAAPIAGEYALTADDGTSGGRRVSVERGARFPSADDGYAWVLARTGRGAHPHVRSLAQRHGRVR